MHLTTARTIAESYRGALHRLRTYRRDWLPRMFGIGCSVLGTCFLLLAACSTNPAKLEPTSNAAPQSIPISATPPPPPITIESEPAIVSPWQRLRQQFVLADCDYGPRVEIWAKRYTSNATGFSQSLSQAMPLLLFVVDQIEQRHMPGEFALLPYVESTYVPSAKGGHAAGIWQLMPAIAQENGLRVGSDFDARLDVPSSTTLALDLLQRYYDEFGDWRLADMAFNAGEYRVKKLVSSDEHKRTSAQLRRTGLHPITHAHLNRLMALACIVSDPQRFAVQLPEPRKDDILAVVDLKAPVDLALAAHLAAMQPDRLQYLNPGYRHGRMPINGPFGLLLPKVHRAALVANLAKLPQSIWPQWHIVVLRQAEPLPVLAAARDVDPQVLAAANLLDVDTTFAAGAPVLLPNASNGESQSTASEIGVGSGETRNHVVRQGDTLSSIAHGAHVSVRDLCRWNELDRDAILKVGQRLRVDVGEAGLPVSAASPARVD